MKNYYYPRTIKGVSIALSSMFNKMVIHKYDTDLNSIEEIEVPFKFGAGDKNYAIRKEEEQDTKNYSFYPKISLLLTGMNFASDRSESQHDTRYFYDPDATFPSGISTFIASQTPTPYTFNYDLTIKTRSLDEMAQLLENILPYFNPMLSLRVKEFQGINIERDLPVKIEGYSIDLKEEQPMDEMRIISSTISFSVEGQMYKPLSDASIIKNIETNFIISENVESTINIG